MKLKDVVREVRSTHKGDITNIPIVGLEHITPYEITFEKYLMDSESTFTKLFKKGQVLFGRRRAYQHKAAIAHMDGICSGDIMVLEAIPGKIDPNLLPFVIQNDGFFDYAIQHSEGGLSPRVKWSAIANYEFTLPSLDEQKVLADKLWAAYRVKESYKKFLAATDDMLKAKFMEMFGEEKETVSYGELFYDDTRHATKIVAADYKVEGKYAIYDQSSDKVICGYTDTEDGVCLDYPTILFGDHSRIIKYIDSPFFIGADGVKIIRPFGNVFNIKFAYYMLKYYNIPNTGYNRHYKYLQATKFFCPPLHLQQEFVAIATQAEATKESLRKSIENIDQVIKSLVNQ